MVTLQQRLNAHRQIGLNSVIFIYHFEAHPTYLPLTTVVFNGLEHGQFSAITATVTLMEITVHPWRIGRSDIAREYETLLTHFPHLTIADVTRDVARQAAQLRTAYAIRPADALQVATALTNGAKAWVTNDKRLKQLSPEIDIILLEDFVEIPSEEGGN